MTALDPDCVRNWRHRTAEIRDRLGELVRLEQQRILTDAERQEMDRLKRESSKSVTEFLVGRYDVG